MTSPSTDHRYGLNSGLAFKAPCACASTANLTLNGEQTVDGVTTSSSRVLVKDQSDATQNGIYMSDTGDWTREPDFNGNRDVVTGTLVIVTAGSANVDTIWQVTSANPITIDSTSIVFERWWLDSVNVFTKNQSVAPVALTSTSNSIAVDASLGNNFEITLTENTTLAAPTNLTAGMHLFFRFVQDSTPRTLAFASIYKFDGGTDGVMPTASGAVAIMDCYCPTGAARLESVFNGASGMS